MTGRGILYCCYSFFTGGASYPRPKGHPWLTGHSSVGSRVHAGFNSLSTDAREYGPGKGCPTWQVKLVLHWFIIDLYDYPKCRYTLVRYEDMADNMVDVMASLYNRLGLQWTDDIRFDIPSFFWALISRKWKFLFALSKRTQCAVFLS